MKFNLRQRQRLKFLQAASHCRHSIQFNETRTNYIYIKRTLEAIIFFLQFFFRLCPNWLVKELVKEFNEGLVKIYLCQVENDCPVDDGTLSDRSSVRCLC